MLLRNYGKLRKNDRLLEKQNMKVYIKTPARLHFGLIELNGDLGRMFGGLGVGINKPNVSLEAYPSSKLIVNGENSELLKTLVDRFKETYNVKSNVTIDVKQTIPEHCGLGSGTQLALAVATAMAKLFKVKAPTRELAAAMGRMQRTCVGTSIFAQGGFVVDGGKNTEDNSLLPPLIFRKPFPEEWRFVVAIPNAPKGLSNEKETKAFKKVAPMPPEGVGRICRLIMMKLLPALVEHDIGSFGEALTQIQNVLGDNFAEVQGGRYTNASAVENIEFMQRLGAYGVGQSSWGPALYGLVTKEKTKETQSKLQAFLNKKTGGQVFLAKAANRGAYMKITK
jgi:beta-RFAP synthase